MEGKIGETETVLVAAGLSSRMGEFKSILPLGDPTIALHMITILKRLGVSPLVAAAGHRVGELKEHLSRAGVQFMRDERSRETRMFNSVKLGIEAAARECGRIMVLPMGVPAIMSDTIRQIPMIDGGIMRTICRGEPEHPIIFQSRVAEQLCAYRGEGGLRGTIEDSDGGTTDLEVEGEGIYWGVDIREEYRELVEWDYKGGGDRPITPLVQVWLKTGDAFFGLDTGRFLNMTHQTGPIQEVCCRIGLSYGKGSHMIWEVERQLGITVVERRNGGMDGGDSGLTDESKRLMNGYARMVVEVRQGTEQIFLKYFGKGINS